MDKKLMRWYVKSKKTRSAVSGPHPDKATANQHVTDQKNQYVEEVDIYALRVHPRILKPLPGYRIAPDGKFYVVFPRERRRQLAAEVRGRQYFTSYPQWTKKKKNKEKARRLRQISNHSRLVNRA